MDTEASNGCNTGSPNELVPRAVDVTANNNVVQADEKPVIKDGEIGDLQDEEKSSTESISYGGATEQRPMSKREQKRALKRKVCER